ncbi:MAG: chromosomal replication initiator protein DnaA [Chloroflexi bacterium]|nr:chromosomal replication initiator protein DnaA [Chloroflexota bacterium]MCI0648558.1 chromosomal replication initiator protein DnaA [Chloroflexota bacterium]MCI0727321.1 chromosomal replication initiator protein DnaA [Chloroflexota bacterium]
MNAEVAWKATLGELELQMTKATFNTWLKDARLLDSTDDEYVVGVRNDYAKDWLENRLQDTILRTLSTMVGYPVNVRFIVSSDEAVVAPSLATKNGRGEKAMSEPVHEVSSNGHLNHRYTFSTFVVGPSNRLAHAAALSVAERPGFTYNPLFIYGGVGLGKTHLLHAIGQRCHEIGCHVCYVSSETFTNDLIQSIRSQKMAQFREKYRTVDVLLIDDIQFIAGKESTQEELFHTFNDLHSRGKQVVLSSDRPPKAMVTLEERLQSRFEWGLMADIQLPDIETRTAILRAKAESSNLHVPDEVLDTIAHHVRKNIRELEGALNKVVAYAQLTGGKIDGHLASLALSDLVHKPEKVTVEQVFEIVASYYHVTVDGLRSNSRSRTVAFPRQMAMYLARTETGLSFPQIGERLGNRDHTTVLYGYEKISDLVETDTNIRRDILEIKATLYDISA